MLFALNREAPMNAALVIWLFLRTAGWLLWLGYVGYSIKFSIFRESHLDPYGHLLITTEFLMFGLPMAAVFAGFLELMMRERVGLPRPRFGQLIPAADRQHPAVSNSPIR
jgi:hypothetical protein